jgi:putative flippase GtrA
MRRHRLLDRTLVIYLAVNVFCWLVGTGLMFLLFNVFHCSYWVSSACNYLVGGTLGYLLNRKYTFRNHDSTWLVIGKYVLHMAICYFIAYSLAPPLVESVLDDAGFHLTGNLSLALGALLFAVINYFGQRYLVFRRLTGKHRQSQSS